MTNDNILRFRQAVEDDMTLAKDIVEMFSVDAPNFINEIAQSMEANNLEQMAAKLHKLKGSLNWVGFEQTADFVLQLETQVKQEQQVISPAELSELSTQVDGVKNELNDFIAYLSS